MSLEQELEGSIRLSEQDLADKIEALDSAMNATQILTWATENIFGPLLRNHQDAILRLAREIDELKGESPS